MATAVNAPTAVAEAAGNATSSPATTPRRATSSGFIIGPVCDSLFIIGAPLLALALALPLFSLPASTCTVSIQGKPVDGRQVFITAFIAAHLSLVFFRSHLNAKIFWTHPVRFSVVPAALLISMAVSVWALAIVGAIAIWWDVYHSSMQTFGFGRIYDSKQSNDPLAGRKLDIWVNLFLYMGPVLAGAQFARHIGFTLTPFNFLNATENPLRDLVQQQAPSFLLGHQRYLTIGVLAAGIPFLAYYLYSYYRLAHSGYRVSWQKVSLLAIAGGVSTYVWGFRSFFDAFWVMNFFHALQYFTIVFYTERKNLARLFRVERFALGGAIILAWLVLLTFLYGLWAGFYSTGAWMTSTVITVSIMHFWYDGFIWSVKKKQV